MLDLEKIKSMFENISSPPWSFDKEDGAIETISGGCVAYVQPHGNLRTIARTGEEWSNADGEFIAAAPTIIKNLIEEIESMKEQMTDKEL